MNIINLEDLKKIMPSIFEKVKRDVRKITGGKRAGLSLGLVEMGMYQGAFIGGMHFSPGTDHDVPARLFYMDPRPGLCRLPERRKAVQGFRLDLPGCGTFTHHPAWEALLYHWSIFIPFCIRRPFH